MVFDIIQDEDDDIGILLPVLKDEEHVFDNETVHGCIYFKTLKLKTPLAIDNYFIFNLDGISYRIIEPYNKMTWKRKMEVKQVIEKYSKKICKRLGYDANELEI